MAARQEDDIALLLLDFLPLSAPLSFALPALPDNLRRGRRLMEGFADSVETLAGPGGRRWRCGGPCRKLK
ncbi:MAG: hypothetical protein HYY39_03560 [Armatimonadetes bacterium]|nr:hypothetical protein [Armatimonadota bacterium]